MYQLSRAELIDELEAHYRAAMVCGMLLGQMADDGRLGVTRSEADMVWRASRDARAIIKKIEAADDA